MAYNEYQNDGLKINEDGIGQSETIEELFAEELEDQHDFASPASTFSSASSASTGSCPFSSVGTATTAATLG